MPLLLHEIEKPFRHDSHSKSPRPALSMDVRDALVRSDLSMKRNKNPLVRNFLDHAQAHTSFTRLMANSVNAEHPMKGYLICCRDERTIGQIIGLGIVTEGVPLFDRSGKPRIPVELGGKFTVCTAMIGLDNIDLLIEAYDLMKGLALPVSTSVAIEPLASPDEVHIALENVFGLPQDGKYATGPQGKRPPISRIYGLDSIAVQLK